MQLDRDDAVALLWQHGFPPRKIEEILSQCERAADDRERRCAVCASSLEPVGRSCDRSCGQHASMRSCRMHTHIPLCTALPLPLRLPCAQSRSLLGQRSAAQKHVRAPFLSRPLPRPRQRRATLCSAPPRRAPASAERLQFAQHGHGCSSARKARKEEVPILASGVPAEPYDVYERQCSLHSASASGRLKCYMT